MCVIFGDEGCGAVDCVNEASTNISLPTIVLDTRQSTLRESITHFLLSSPISSRSLRFFIRLSNLSNLVRPSRQANSSILQDYLQSLSDEELFHLFQSLLEQYRTVDRSSSSNEKEDELDENQSSTSPSHQQQSHMRSCSVILRVSSLSSLSRSDLQVLQKWQSQCNSVFFFLVCSNGPLSEYEEIPSHSVALYVGL